MICLHKHKQLISILIIIVVVIYLILLAVSTPITGFYKINLKMQITSN